MRLTLSQLKKIIKEEVARTLKESTGEDPKTQLIQLESLLHDAKNTAAKDLDDAKEILLTQVLPILNDLIEKFVGLGPSRDEQHPILIMTRNVEAALELRNSNVFVDAVDELIVYVDEQLAIDGVNLSKLDEMDPELSDNVSDKLKFVAKKYHDELTDLKRSGDGKYFLVLDGRVLAGPFNDTRELYSSWIPWMDRKTGH